MTSILVVCTGNICRSPIAAGLLRGALGARFGDDAPIVTSAGTWGSEGQRATPEAVAAAAERGVDIADHRARRLSLEMAAAADLVIGMAGEHREAVSARPDVRERTFTLKELVRLVEAGPPAAPPPAVVDRVAQAARLREEGFPGNPLDEDVADPLGLPFQSYRAIAWELDGYVTRLVDGVYGAGAAAAAGGG